MKVVSVAALALVIGTGAAPASPRAVWVPCLYPHGWNSTDASREVWGVPPDSDHRCLVEYGRDHNGRWWGWREDYLDR